MIKVSVIVPVYNGESYIKACIDSILNQTLKEIEIIVINDGSIDNTNKVLENYRKEYPNQIKVIEKENEGQGKARNVGINLAKGEFLTFVDSDDTIEPNMLKKMYDTIKKQHTDIAISDYNEIWGKNQTIKKSILRNCYRYKKKLHHFLCWTLG